MSGDTTDARRCRHESHDAEQACELISRRRQIADRMLIEFREERIARGGEDPPQAAMGLDHAMPVGLAFIGETTNYRKIVFGLAHDLADA